MTHCAGTILQGAGQGNTGAAPFWTSVSTIMIEEMKSKQMHAQIIAPLSGIAVIPALIAFVNDTELFIMHPLDNLKLLIQSTQAAL